MKAGWDQAIHGNFDGDGVILLDMHGIALQAGDLTPEDIEAVEGRTAQPNRQLH